MHNENLPNTQIVKSRCVTTLEEKGLSDTSLFTSIGKVLTERHSQKAQTLIRLPFHELSDLCLHCYSDKYFVNQRPVIKIVF